MKSDRESLKQELKAPVIASLVVFLFALVFWLIPAPAQPPPKPWFINVSAGLMVLGFAGIWVSFFAGRRAAYSLRADIDGRFSILSVCLDAHIHDVHYDETDPGHRDDTRYRTKIISESLRAKELQLLGIALLQFFHEGQGFAYDTMYTLAKEGRVKIRVLLLHPWSEQAVSRALKEDGPHRRLEDYKQSTLFMDIVGKTCDELVRNWPLGSPNFEVRLHKVFPACFLFLHDHLAFVEQYHFGTRGRASGKVPVLEVAEGGRYYRELAGHFKHVWETAAPYTLTAELLDRLNDPSDEEMRLFEETIRFLRPDLT